MTLTRTPTFLMANLGSEVSRILDWKEKGDIDMALKCYERAKSIEKEIAEAPSMKDREAELGILRDVIDDLFQEKSRYEIKSSTLKEYFYPFTHRIFG